MELNFHIVIWGIRNQIKGEGKKTSTWNGKKTTTNESDLHICGGLTASFSYNKQKWQQKQFLCWNTCNFLIWYNSKSIVQKILSTSTLVATLHNSTTHIQHGLHCTVYSTAEINKERKKQKKWKKNNNKITNTYISSESNSEKASKLHIAPVHPEKRKEKKINREKTEYFMKRALFKT